MANDNKDNDENESTIASGRISTPTIEKEIVLDGAILSNDDNMNDNSVTSDETNSTGVTSDSMPTTEEEIDLDGAIDINDNACDQPSDSLPTIDNETSPEVALDSNGIDVDVSTRLVEKVQTEESPKSISEESSSETEVPSTESDVLQNLPVSNESTTDEIIEWSEENDRPSDAHEVDDNDDNDYDDDDEFSETPSVEEEEEENVTNSNEGLDGVIDNDQNDIILTSNETNACGQPSDSLPTIDNETSPEGALDSNRIDDDISSRLVEKVQSEESPKSVSEVSSSETEVPSTESDVLQNLPVSNESTTDNVEFIPEEEHAENTDIAFSDDTSIKISDELTTDEAEWSEENIALGHAHEVHDNDDEFSEIPSIEDEADYYSDEVDSENLSVVEEEEDGSDDDESSIPDGDTTEDLYALLAMSKKRLAKTEIDEEDENSNSGCEVEESNELVNDVTSNMHDADENKLKEAENNKEENKNMIDEDDSVQESIDDDDGGISCTSASIRSVGSDKKVEEKPQISEQEADKKKKDKHNAELWALLKYSKVRLSTGAIPTIAEDQGEGGGHDMDMDDCLSFGDDELRSSQSTLGTKNMTTIMDEDDLSLADDVSLSYGVNDNARSRALDALNKVSEQQVRLSVSEQHVRLSDKQLRQSVKLAEEAARTGAPEFRTSNNLSALDKVQLTDKFRRNRAGNFQRRRRSGDGGARSNAMRERFGNFKMKFNNVFDDFKKTCDRASTMDKSQRNCFNKRIAKS